MAAPLEKLRQFNVFLLKSTITEYRDALLDEKLDSVHLISGLDFRGELFYRSQPRTDPEWLQFLRTGAGGTIPPFASTSLAVVLFISTAKRIFALTFGYGRYLLDPEAYERRFGLKVVVNRVAPDMISTLDLKRFEDVVVKRHEETSRSTSLGAFGVNIRQDLLRAVAGVPTGITLDGLPGKTVERISGSDCLCVHARLRFKQLGLLCRGALTASGDKAYTKHGWRWIDNLAAVTDPTRISEMDQLLVDELKAGRLSTIEMTLPDEINANNLKGVIYVDDDTQMSYPPQLDAGEWYRTIKADAPSLTVKSLKAKRIALVGVEEGIPLAPVSAYACLNFEPPGKAGTRCLLANGEWFEVSNDYDKEINDYIAAISNTTAALPDAADDDTEPEYIARVTSPGKLDCLHTANIGVDGEMIELCDLLSPDGHMIHLKRWTASATFSTLLSQGAVAAETLVMKPGYLKAAHGYLIGKKISAAKRFAPDLFITRDLEVVFGLMRSSARPLPFFSRLNLMRNGERIQTMGYRVGYKRIPGA